jgi:hypothetical protein
MHEAEATLTEVELWIMACQIERNRKDHFYFRATARERAEAFLRTLEFFRPSIPSGRIANENHL